MHLASILLANQLIIRIIIPIINLFVYLPNFCIIVYTGQKCKYTVLPIYIDCHLSSLYYNYNKEQQKQVVQEISQIDKLIQNARELELFVFPELTSLAIPELNIAKPNRLKYQLYRYVICY